MKDFASFTRPFAVLAALMLVATPLAFAADARLVVDPAIYDVELPDEGPERAGITLAFNGSFLEVHVIESGAGNLPDVNLGFTGETPRTRPFSQVDLSAVVERSPKLQTWIGGVILEHRNTNVLAVKSAYASALADLGFTLSDASTRTRWQFTNGVESMHVNVVPEGKNVITYVGR